MSLGYGGTKKEHDRAGHSLLILRCILFLLSSLSILSLLSYFLGLGPFARLTSVMLAIEILGIVFLVIWMKRTKKTELSDRLIRGLWAGALATLAYDVVRVPIAHAGMPVFKAISYFGTVFMGIESPTPLSEAVGWAYHLSNGVSFALMYVVMISRPGPVTAVLW